MYQREGGRQATREKLIKQRGRRQRYERRERTMGIERVRNRKKDKGNRSKDLTGGL